MSPEQVSVLTNLLGMFKLLSGWPFALFFFLMVIGPWVLSLMLFYSQRKRFEAVVGMYESNVKLVEKYEKIACDLKDIVIMNTQAQTALTEVIRQINK